MSLNEKIIQKPIYLLNNISISGTNTYNSVPLNVQTLQNLGLQVTYTGTQVGTLSILASVDSVLFYSLTFNPALTQPSGSDLGFLIDLNQFPYFDIQVQYVNSSGTGSISVVLCGKALD